MGSNSLGLESVGGLAIHIILSKLCPCEVAVVGCLSRRFRAWAFEDDPLWAQFCFKDLDLSLPFDPDGNPTASFKEAYQKWREAFSMYPWPLVTRVKKCWTVIKDWSALNFPEILPTLRRGASEEEIEEFEKSLKIKLPLPTRVIYRFCDGQELPVEEFSGGSLPSSLLGLIGGYSMYDHLVNVFLLPLNQVILDTQSIMHQLGFSNRSKFIAVAASATYSEKIFFLNCSSGQLFVGTRNLVTDGEMLPCVPDALISSVHDSKGVGQQDGLLLWLEEHGRRLQNGTIGVRQEGRFRSICLFPETPPLCSSAITNGVKVRASAAFVPEFSNLLEESEKFLFAYSIRLSLSPNGCVINGTTFESCQLYWRHWVIRANETVIASPHGEAVIGKFPLLRPGEEEFVYESCTPLPASQGSVEGSFTFVPGRLADPKGSTFRVEVARFPLQLPDYIF